MRAKSNLREFSAHQSNHASTFSRASCTCALSFSCSAFNEFVALFHSCGDPLPNSSGPFLPKRTCYVELNQYNKYSLVQPEELTPGQDPVTSSHTHFKGGKHFPGHAMYRPTDLTAVHRGQCSKVQQGLHSRKASQVGSGRIRSDQDDNDQV